MLPKHPLKIQPGLFTLTTDRGANGRWKDGDKVRFRHGMPEKLGGWLRNGANTFLGKCRALTDWISLTSSKLIGVGTHLKLYVWQGGSFFDITPIRTSGTLALNPFTTTDTSAVVNVAHVAHGNMAGDYVHFSGATAVGGITIDGTYTVTEVIDDDNFTITHSAAATSTATGGGAAVDYEYEIHVGNADSYLGLGWGARTWGESTWGTARTLSSFLTNARIWSLDQWGEDLIGCPRGGGIYVWDTSVGVTTRAAAISGAPETARAIFVSPENQHLVALGAHTGSADDPLLIRWSDSEDYTVWTAGPSNSAGQKRLNTGNEILCGVKTRAEILIFTDSNLWSMRFQGPPNQFSFKDIGPHGGMRGPNAVVVRNGITYWMGEKEFYYYNGNIKTLECEVHPTVFKNINAVQRFKVFAVNSLSFGELWWLYCSADATEVDRYVIFNPDERHWSFGTIARTAMVGDSDIFGLPYATGEDGYLYDHETGTDDNEDAMVATLESGDVEIGDGDDMMVINALVPDFEQLTGSIALTLKARRYPQGPQTTKGPLTITSATEVINPRIKGRQVALAFESSALGDHWRMGSLRIGTRAKGKK